MDELRYELKKLTDELERGRPQGASPEGQALQYLNPIQLMLEGRADPAGIAAAFDALKQFWLDSVAWCSALSRDIEKIIIIYGELSEENHLRRPSLG